jgi:hypothetical protein
MIEPLTYETYCDVMIQHNLKPMTREQWNKDEDERTPTVRKNKDSRPKPATFKEYEDESI